METKSCEYFAAKINIFDYSLTAIYHGNRDLWVFEMERR